MIEAIRQQVQSLSDANNRDRDRQITIDRMIADEVAIAGLAASDTQRGSSDGAVPQTAAQELSAVKAALDRMLLRLKEDHPDVRAAKRRIGELEERAAAEALTQPMSAEGRLPASTPGEIARAQRISALRIETEQLERNITGRNAQAARLQARPTTIGVVLRWRRRSGPS
jgi:hypothetical protein